MNKKYKIIALVGESGSGKDRILKSLSSLPYHWNKIINCTTRPKRSYEKEDIDYHFVDSNYFLENVFLEASDFNCWQYGTAENDLKEDIVNVGVFNTKSIPQLINNPLVSELIIYRIDVRPEERLLRQLSRDKNVDVTEVVRRFRTEQADFRLFDKDFALHMKHLQNEDEFNLAENYVEIGRQIRSMNH